MSPVVLTVLGTRPEAIKMAPVLSALAEGPVRSVLCVTGQHPELLGAALDELGVAPDHALEPVLAGSDLAGLTAHVLEGLAPVLAEVAPTMVLVHGDTTSALAATLAATLARVPVAHVEAGLRTGDLSAPFPEEANRAVIDRLASLHLAPTSVSEANLLAEGIDPSGIVVTGNPVVDALERAPRGGLSIDLASPLVLVTCHRRETLGAPLQGICDVVRRLAEGATVLWPVHPNPAVAGPVRAALHGVAGVHLVDPLPYSAFLQALEQADLVLTDSGGVQEEAALLGRPVLVLRECTERPEVLATGVVRIVGVAPTTVRTAALAWLRSPPQARPGVHPLGLPGAGERIAAAVERWLGVSRRAIGCA